MASSDEVPTILCAGIAVYDYVFQVDRFPTPGMKKRARRFAAVGGGCAANAAVAIARLGGRARFAAPLGGPPERDALGERILADLAREGVVCDGVIRAADAPSPMSAIWIDDTGERMIVNYRADDLTTLRPSDPHALVAAADALLVDNRFADFVRPLCRAARDRGLPVVVDGDRPTTRSDAMFSSATHVVFAADGLRATAATDDLGEGLRRMAEMSTAFLAVTDGPAGVLWLAGRDLRRQDAFAVTAVDTLGAGDVFHGAFALALGEGRSEEDAIRFGAAAAALKCTRFGGITGAPRRDEVERFLAGPRPRA